MSLPAFRFPNLFPPLKPETVARRTVEAVQLNQALLLLPWTMHALVILKRYGAGEESSEPGFPTISPSPGGPWWGRGLRQEKVHMGSISHVCSGHDNEEWWSVCPGFPVLTMGQRFSNSQTLRTPLRS